MPISVAPVVTQWYRHLDQGQPFQVVALDEEAGMVEVQNFDGDVEEMDLGEWYELEVEPMDSPDDWAGSVEDTETDDPGYGETGVGDRDWLASRGE